MSYILDALQRANAERDRGAVPGLHAQQINNFIGQSEPGSKGRLWVALLLACTLTALGTGLWIGRGSAPRATPMQADVAPVAPLVAAPAAAPPAATQRARAELSEPAVTDPTVTPPPARAIARDSMPAPAPVKLNPAPPPPPFPWLAELPEDARRQIAMLTITGVVYSENPGQRLLLVNGQVLPQGSTVVPEVTLEEIGERHSVFNFRGMRFRVAH